MGKICFCLGVLVQGLVSGLLVSRPGLDFRQMLVFIHSLCTQLRVVAFSWHSSEHLSDL